MTPQRPYVDEHAIRIAAFPGAAGRVYRTLVIGTRLRVVATKHVLRAVRAGV